MIDRCVTLNTINDTTNWAKNSGNTILNIMPVVFPPLLTYEELKIINISDDDAIIHYRYCGPMIILLKSFAQFINNE